MYPDKYALSRNGEKTKYYLEFVDYKDTRGQILDRREWEMIIHS
jgi:hypothetical protein